MERNDDIFADAEEMEREAEDTPTVQEEEGEEYSFDYEEDSVDLMFNDINSLRDEYQILVRVARQCNEEDIALLDDMYEDLHRSFATLRNAIAQRLQWTESYTNSMIGTIERPRIMTYLQNTERVTETEAVATMVDLRNFDYAIYVPSRLLLDTGEFIDYDIYGEEYTRGF